MKCNVGKSEKIIRLILGIILLLISFNFSGYLALTMIIIAGILAITSIMGRCPLWVLLKINTCNTDKK